jgi:uncharacterized membrane protein YobD (UPF0266 family)
MTRTGRAILIAFVAWTAFVWCSRISNTLRSTTESAGGKVFSTVLSVIMLLFAAAVVVVLVRRWSTSMDPASARALRAAAVVTVVVWLIRVPQIVFLDDDPTHGAPFKIVHAVLGLISIGLAAGLWRVATGAMRRPVPAASVPR